MCILIHLLYNQRLELNANRFGQNMKTLILHLYGNESLHLCQCGGFLVYSLYLHFVSVKELPIICTVQLYMNDESRDLLDKKY